MSFAEDNAQAWSEITELHRSRPAEFGAIETANGPGATVEQTEALRASLPLLFGRHDVKTVLDIGCGDWNWMSHVDLDGLEHYTGWDVEPSLIAADVERFADRPNVSFAVQSVLTAEALPTVDLILARQVLIHFPNEEIAALLDKMRASGVKYLLTSHWPDGSNEDYEPEGFGWRGYMERALDLEAPPFGLNRVDAIPEPAASAGVLVAAHELALFELIPQPGLADYTPCTCGTSYANDHAEDCPSSAQSAMAAAGVQGGEGSLAGVIGTVKSGLISTEDCEHPATYRVHRGDDTVATVCTRCDATLEVKGEAGGAFSFHDTLARWAADVQEGGLGASERAARLQGRSVSRKELLAGLKKNHREVVQMVANDTSLEAAWLLLGAQTAVLDAILDELLGGGGG